MLMERGVFFAALISSGSAQQPGAAATATAATATRMCDQCIGGFQSGEDAGAYKDIKVAGCQGMCDCAVEDSPCFDAAGVGKQMVSGSAPHQAACCALCSATPGCVGWVISTALNNDGSPAPPGSQCACWLKNQMTPIEAGQPQRGHGTVKRGFGPASCSAGAGWGATVSALILGGGTLYALGGSVYGARVRGARISLAVHPHYEQWLVVAALSADGVTFCQERLGITGRGQRTPPSSGNNSQRRNTSTKKEAKQPSPKKGKKLRKGEKVSRAGAPVQHEAQAALLQEPEQQASTPTPSSAAAAGGGGRWVRVPE
jgi:hypothetical protein